MPRDEAARLLITRSQPGADAMAAELAGHGYAVAVCPLIEIEALSRPVTVARARRLAAGDRIVCLSPAAARLGVPLLARAAPVPVPEFAWVAVGRGTADALQAHGIAAAVPDVESSEGLLGLPALAQPEGRIALLCGEGGRTLLAETLRARGVEPIRLEVYRRRVPVRSPLQEAGIDPAQVAAIVVSSGEGADVLARFWPASGGARTVPIIVPSERVAVGLREQGYSRVLVSGGASTAAVVAVLTAMGLAADR